MTNIINLFFFSRTKPQFQMNLKNVLGKYQVSHKWVITRQVLVLKYMRSFDKSQLGIAYFLMKYVTYTRHLRRNEKFRHVTRQGMVKR